MIRKNILQILLLFILALISSIYLVSGSIQQQLNEQSDQQAQTLAVYFSKTNLLIKQVDWQEADAFEKLSERLELFSEVIAWQLTNQQNQLIKKQNYTKLRRLSPLNNDSSHSRIVKANFYLPKTSSIASQALLSRLNDSKNTLQVSFVMNSATDQAAIFSQTTILILLFWSTVFAAFLVYQFKWVNQLEDYSKHVLTTGNNLPIRTQYRFHNVIGHAISQLILNNSRLTKMKSDLAEQIRKTSYIDEVTELGNHLFFKAELEVRLHNHDEAESGLVVLLSFVDGKARDRKDLNREQQIQIANLLKHALGSVTLALTAKLKESEFVLILPNFTAGQTDKFCRDLIDQLAKSVFDKDPEHEHFVDIGVSTYKQGFGYYNIMAEADMALRNAQLQGANSWFVYGEPLSQHKSKGSIRWRSFLQRVLDRREIMLYSQNLHYFTKSSGNHKEILARIQDGKEILSADTFLAMANQCGLATEFDRQIIDSVIKHLLYTESNRKEDKYAINIFICSLLNEKFVSWLIGKLSSYPEINQQLIFEISENHVSNHIDKIAPAMRQISSMGVSWCIEHFGSPNDDLSYLNKAPIHMVKVDRRIINNIAEVPAQQLLLGSIIVSLRSRDIMIFAEGLEKKQDAIYLKTTELDGAQGYHFDKPQKLQFSENRLKVV